MISGLPLNFEEQANGSVGTLLSLLREIVTAMNEHFRTSSVATNLIACVFFVVAGVLMVIAGIGPLLLFQNI